MHLLLQREWASLDIKVQISLEYIDYFLDFSLNYDSIFFYHSCGNIYEKRKIALLILIRKLHNDRKCMYNG